MPVLEDQYADSPCEIKTLSNDLLTTAVIQSVKDEYVEITNPGDILPLIHCDTIVKINIFNSKLGFRVLIGKVFLSTDDYMRVVEVQNLADFEKRNFFRIKVSLSAKAYIIEDDLPPDGTLKLFPIHISDLSLSGCFLRSKKAMNKGQKLIINISLPEDISVAVCAVIQREQEVDFPNSRGYGCAFLDISPHQSDILCTYIFNRQREQIRSMREIQENFHNI